MSNQNNKWYKKRWVIILIAVIGIVIIFGGDDDSQKIKNIENTNKIESQKNLRENNEESLETIKTIDYELVESEDISFNDPNYGIVKRFNVKVLIKNNPVTKKQIEILSEKIIKDYQQQKADAISIFYYFNRSQVSGAYTLAQAEWAPNGKWEEANLKQNQKTTYKFTEFIDKKRTNEPTELEIEINTAMRDLWYEMMKTQDIVTDEETAKILAPRYGKTVEEMLKIRYKVNDYDLGLTQ
ncbi:MAG: hypothetical protein KAQ64_04385 [Candidatus Pacebacteria bacterium]|nr:hypothetical protein [Candidatus Paceibacterota bacterium]